MDQTSANRMEAACSLLAESERRFLLYQLAGERSANLEDLIAQVAAWELDARADAIDKEVRQRVYVSLVHNHLPRLEDYDIIEYDLRSGDIVLAEGFEDIKPLLEQFRQTEAESELRERPPL
ncbi:MULTISPECIES: hypothetical protein [Natrinema]|uniref:DUF7344 domain-containing protein n=1 Tax=Natrinema gari JCM 14663 TaxID=1230459 RepID=L9Z8A7_9EURY|nr:MULTISPECIES: hypothetical protein [Natrinema]AFO57342.1 hypothetical protein NJ7G_2101 [Natrinema sp. J7-2]ELY81408.1 hypothetical protein C486_07108 [Natrinema gari JCM 14663]